MSSALYTPLISGTSTRLLTLRGGLPGDGITCSLDQVDLDSAPEYEAISYTWGDPDKVDLISINGNPVSIRSNLFAALNQVRHSAHPRVLWVDALSISQDDLDEKSQQVTMIGRIFRQASRVLAWVGEHADNSETLFRPQMHQDSSARRAWSAVQIYAGRAKDSFNVLGYGTNLLRPPISIRERSYQSPEWRAFLRRKFWTRTWIVQEISLAKEVIIHCGDDHTDWDELVESRLDFEGSNDDHLLAGRSVADVVNRPDDIRVTYLNMLRHQGQTTHGDIARLASDTKETECQDQRDRIYALLSMETRRPGQGEIVPDYRMEVPELFVEVLRRRYNHVEDWYESSAIFHLCAGMQISRSQGRRIRQLLPKDRRSWQVVHHEPYIYPYGKILEFLRVPLW